MKKSKKNNKKYIIMVSIVGFILLFFMIVPFIKYKDNNTFTYIAFKDYSFKYDEVILCYNVSYFYNKDMLYVWTNL